MRLRQFDAPELRGGKVFDPICMASSIVLKRQQRWEPLPVPESVEQCYVVGPVFDLSDVVRAISRGISCTMFR